MDEVANLKLPELKKECKARGLPYSGNKAELVARLQSAMAAEKPPSDDSVLDDALIDEDSMLGDEDSSGASSNEDSSNAVDLSSPISTVPPVKTLSALSPEKKTEPIKRPAPASPAKTVGHTNGSSEGEGGTSPTKKKIKIDRQPLPPPAAAALPEDCEKSDSKDDKQVVKISEVASAEDKAKLRQAKFGAAAAAAAAAVASPTAAAAIASNPFVDERMKKRAERFGGGATPTETTHVTGKVSLTTDEDVRLAKRKERFGLTAANEVERKDKRAARFGVGAVAAVPAATTTPTPISDSVSTPAVQSSVPATVAETDDKKKLRAARFGAAP